MSETEVILVESFDGRSHSFLYIPFEQKTLQMQKNANMCRIKLGSTITKP